MTLACVKLTRQNKNYQHVCMWGSGVYVHVYTHVCVCVCDFAVYVCMLRVFVVCLVHACVCVCGMYACVNVFAGSR